MPDLIIKPAAQSGNKVIIQDQAGGAVLTTADSGATLAGGIVATASIVDNAVTLAKMASGTDGNIISYDASGNPVAIATGTDGQVLTSTGAGSPPAFEAAGGGLVVSFDSALYTGSDITTTTTGGVDDFIEANSGLRVVINPTSPNKVVLILMGGAPRTNGTTLFYTSWGIVGGDLNLGSSAQGLARFYAADGNTTNVGGHSMAFVYTPTTAEYAAGNISFTPTYIINPSYTGTAHFTEGSANQNIQAFAFEIKQ